MNKLIRSVSFAAALVAAFSVPALSECFQGNLGSSSRYGSGWLDLSEPVSFATGDRLDLLIGGTAGSILVRLLPRGGDPNTSVGLVGGLTKVLPNRSVRVTLKSARPRVIQISVHGGSSPFKVPLGSDNGPATLVQASRNGC